MILQRLAEYYDRLANDPGSAIAPFGFSRERVDFCLILKSETSLPGVNDLRMPNGRGQNLGIFLVVPHHGEKRTANDRPYFLSDGTDYFLGASDDEQNSKRDIRRFELFRRNHLDLESAIAIPEYSLFCRFLEKWTPESVKQLSYWNAGLAGSRLVVKIEGAPGYLHEREPCREAWLKKLLATDGVTRQSLVDGQFALISRVHKAIKGIRDPGGKAEKSIVSFNKNKTAFDSYGKEQGENAPVSVQDAFRYTTALNDLLTRENRRFSLGDATVVFWAEHRSPLEEFISEFLVDLPPAPAVVSIEDKKRAEETRLFLSQMRDGHASHEAFDPENITRFYILGLSPNRSRISVRFWADSTVGEMKARLQRHMNDTALTAHAEERPMTVRQMVNASARLDKGRPVYDSISPHLAGDVAQSVLTGCRYPIQLLIAVVGRIRADGIVDHTRIAVAKACVIRNFEMEVSMALNPEHPSPSYHCGRLLALLEYAQAQAIGNINAGIVKKFYGAASMQPAAVFGRLIAAATKAHIPKLELGLRQFIDRELERITAHIGDSFPAVLPLEDQGMFAIGFYQERAELPQTPPAYRHETERGEQVKSKSEVILANMLNSLRINYQYELPLAIPGSRPLKPDFTIVGDIPSTTVYIEHLGMLENDDYRQKWEAKLLKFRSVGIVPLEEGGGPNGKLIATSESKERGLDSGAIRRKFQSVFSVTE